MVFTDVSSLGASQFRGRHKEDILLELYEAAGKKKADAERGIIFMDEFDKLLLPAISERGVNIHDDVQSQMLTMLEGSEIELKADGMPLLLNTSHMLFVLAGAFQGIEEYIKSDKKKREKMPGNIGFLSPLEKEMDLSFVRDNINHEVLMEYEDFGAFCKAHADVKTTLCQMMTAQWVQTSPSTWYFEIRANRFLRNMVRAVVGTLIDVGRGRVDMAGFRQIIEGKKRTNAGESMPAQALFLEDITY